MTTTSLTQQHDQVSNELNHMGYYVRQNGIFNYLYCHFNQCRPMQGGGADSEGVHGIQACALQRWSARIHWSTAIK